MKWIEKGERGEEKKKIEGIKGAEKNREETIAFQDPGHI